MYQAQTHILPKLLKFILDVHEIIEDLNQDFPDLRI